MTPPPPGPTDGAPLISSFDPRLESLRGLAALIVCVHHGMSVFADNARLVVMDALLLAFNSAAAVIFFFVLSGYVLGRALERDGAFVPYLVRRLFRLLPPFVVVVLFTFACERLFRIDPIPSGLMPGFQRMFWPQPTWDALWDNLLLSSFRVNGPTWTLLTELLGALMLPFVVAVHVRIEPQWRWALFVAIATLLAISPFHTLLWFYFGCFLAREIGTLLAGRRRLAAITFVVGLIGLEMAGTNSEFYAVGIVIPSAIAAALMIGGGGIARAAAVDDGCAVAVPRTNLLQPLFGALADLLRLRLARGYLSSDRADPYLGESARDGDVRDRRGCPSRTVISICRSAVDQSGQIDGACPGADVDEDLATAGRGGLERRLSSCSGRE